ncbi:MAG: right-handed parallel beta-helix repeat-containing protein, partial [Planctomycetes bacterium]|nr:right-handed parallel beta-helix repeat-containing protein [Planctomycetota bacterium]
QSSNPSTITGNTIIGNSASSGAGIGCRESNPIISNNIVAGNQAVANGGGLFLSDQSSPIITNNVFFANMTKSRGGGLCTIISCAPMIANTIFRDNEAPNGPEMWIGDEIVPSTVSISHSNVKGNQSLIQVETGCALDWGSGMIDADPMFVDAANYDFHLMFDSPCGNSGDNTAVGIPAFDFEGDPRTGWDGTVDMGADEFYTHLYYTGDATPGGAIEGKLIGLPGTWPVGLFFGSGILENPIQHMWGEFWLIEPMRIFPLVAIPADGVLVMPLTLHVDPPAPWDLPMQGLVGTNSDSLTNLCVLEVR